MPNSSQQLTAVTYPVEDYLQTSHGLVIPADLIAS